MSNSISLMLIPSSDYIAARPKTKDHHLTLAYFGKLYDNDQRAISRLHTTVDNLARYSDPIPAKANGIGLFDAGQDGFAVVDLIDGIGTFRMRQQIENLYGRYPDGSLDGVNIDYTHGFTPHMTREYLAREDEFYGEIGPDMIDNLSFEFVAVGLWYGDNRYEVEL